MILPHFFIQAISSVSNTHIQLTNTTMAAMKCLGFILCLTGSSLCVEIQHCSHDFFLTPGKSVLTCCSLGQSNFRQMMWYQRLAGDTALKLIGYLNNKDATMEEPYKQHYSIYGDLSGDEEKLSSLMINVKNEAKSAVYFCAAREAH